jgi:hypothetical protein
MSEAQSANVRLSGCTVSLANDITTAVECASAGLEEHLWRLCGHHQCMWADPGARRTAGRH